MSLPTPYTLSSSRVFSIREYGSSSDPTIYRGDASVRGYPELVTVRHTMPKLGTLGIEKHLVSLSYPLYDPTDTIITDKRVTLNLTLMYPTADVSLAIVDQAILDIQKLLGNGTTTNATFVPAFLAGSY